jgi:capsular polysaccharide export protein
MEYFGYTRRLPLLRFHKSRDHALTDSLIQNAIPFYLLPLQLGSDAQIRDHSRFHDMTEVMAYVMESFAEKAPEQARLVIKNHPLDTGLINYPKIIHKLTTRFALTGRVEYMETGDLHALLRHAQGTVTVNSTVGMASLGLNCPTIALSNPIYNLPGLTYQGHLDDFWQDNARPDAELFRYFRNTVIHATQVNGGFYSRPGIELAVENCRQLLNAKHSPLEQLFQQTKT